MITLKDVTKTFRMNDGTERTVLRRLHVTVEDQQFMCLLGPSGCGKSTLLRLISGLDRPTEGEICIDGQPVTGPPPGSSFVFQNYALFPWLTVLENVMFNLAVNTHSSSRERQEKGRHYLHLVHLDDYADSYIYQLSGGMRQRVAIARALSIEPSILFMDEPFGALDTFTRMELQELLRQLCGQRQITIIFVTHDIDEAIYLSNTVAVLNANTGGIDQLIPIAMEGVRDRTGSQFNEYRRKIYEAFHVCRPEDAAIKKGVYII